MKTSKAYTKWESRILDTVTPWTEKEIIYFRKAIGLAGLRDVTEIDSLLALFRDKLNNNSYYSITPEQAKKGTEYLLSKSLKKDGSRRKGCKLGERELDILRDPNVEHTFVGLMATRGGRFVPIYSASKGGDYFEYTGTTYDYMEVLN